MAPTPKCQGLTYKITIIIHGVCIRVPICIMLQWNEHYFFWLHSHWCLHVFNVLFKRVVLPVFLGKRKNLNLEHEVYEKLLGSWVTGQSYYPIPESILIQRPCGVKWHWTGYQQLLNTILPQVLLLTRPNNRILKQNNLVRNAVPLCLMTQFGPMWIVLHLSNRSLIGI